MDTDLHIALETPRIEARGPMLLAGERGRYSLAENALPLIGAQWERFAPRIGSIPGEVGAAAYGLFFDMFSGGDHFDLLTAVEVSTLAHLPGNLSSLEMPEQTYAIFPHPHHMDELRRTVYSIWLEWLPGSGHSAAKGVAPEFIERYGEDFDPVTGLGSIEVWVPIKV